MLYPAPWKARSRLDETVFIGLGRLTVSNPSWVSDLPEFPPDGLAPMEIVVMHYYQFNIGDYTSHTRHLEPLEDLAYRRMLDLYYLHERPLDGDATSVAKQIGLRDEAAMVRDVLNEFFVLTDDGYRSTRADREIEHYRAKVQQASRAGKASAQRRLNGRSTDSATDVQPNNNQETINNTNTIAPSDSRSPQVSWSIDGFKIEPEVLKTFELAYPAVNLNTEIAKAHAWAVANPKNRKSNWSRFLNSWLQKAQDRAPVVKSTDWRDDPRFRGIV